MSEVQRFPGGPHPQPADPADPGRGVGIGRFEAPLRLVPSTSEQASPPGPEAVLRDWDGLVDLVHGAAGRARRIETRVLDQDRSFGEALRRAHEGIIAAERHALQAETLADAAHRRADDRIATAEARAAAAEAQAHEAEDRARHAEAWLMRVQATILAEFPEPHAQAAA